MDSPSYESLLTQRESPRHKQEPEVMAAEQTGSSEHGAMHDNFSGSHKDELSRSDNNAVTPSPEPHPLSRHNTGLPPTPPTMSNSEVAAAQTEPADSPPQVFADRVRNALESRKSALTTPIDNSNTPPTPDISPGGVTSQSRPALRNDYTSFTESFITATEGLSGSDSTSHVHSPNTEQDRKHDWLNIPLPSRPSVTRTGSDETVGEVRVKNYQMESDSDSHKNPSLRSNNTDESPTSPLVEITSRYHRLRRPIEPGDDLKRIDNAMIYGTSNWKNITTTKSIPDKAIPQAPPAAQVKTTLPQAHDKSAIMASPMPESESEPKVEARSLFAAVAPRQVTPPAQLPAKSSPASDATLEGNNIAYKLIQKENAKRWSVISQGSGIQAIVVTTPQRSRTLRHTSKCDSLRDEVSVTPIGSKESSPVCRSEPHDDKIRSKRYGDLTKNPVRAVTLPSTEQRRPVANIKLPLSRTAIQGGQRSASESQPRKLRRSNRDIGLDRVTSLRSDLTPRALSLDLSHANGASKSTTATALHQLRRTSAEKRLDRDDSVRRTSLGAKMTEVTASHQVRRTSQEQSLSYNNDVRRSSMPISEKIAAACLAFEPATIVSLDPDQYKPAQDQEKDKDTMPAYIGLFSTQGLDGHRRHSARAAEPEVLEVASPRSLHYSATPMSVSQLSYVTEGEVCEATGMEIYPHDNASVLMVQTGSQAVQGLGLTGGDLAGEEHTSSPVFEAYVQQPTKPDDEHGQSLDVDRFDSQTVAEPPKLVFIPPTPVEDPDRQLAISDNPPPRVQRKASFKDIMRRYSESLAQPLLFGRSGSFRRHSYSPYQRSQPAPALEARPTYLSSLWQPRDFWEDYASSDEDDDDFFEDQTRLPPGGDTSEIRERRGFFPRSMSVRMPGFRGTGGFLRGNSLGIERHGTNNRRHYIAKPSGDGHRQESTERKRRSIFTLPFTGGTRVEYVGWLGVSAKLKDAKARREERAAEREREMLKTQSKSEPCGG